jgi:hypothetical protein
MWISYRWLHFHACPVQKIHLKMYAQGQGWLVWLRWLLTELLLLMVRRCLERPRHVPAAMVKQDEMIAGYVCGLSKDLKVGWAIAYDWWEWRTIRGRLDVKFLQHSCYLLSRLTRNSVQSLPFTFFLLPVILFPRTLLFLTGSAVRFASTSIHIPEGIYRIGVSRIMISLIGRWCVIVA